MRKTIFLVTAGFFIQAAFQSCIASVETDNTRVIAVDGRAFFSDQKSIKQPLRVGQKLEAGDQVDTGTAGTVDLAFDDDFQNVVRVEENSRMNVQRSATAITARLDRGGLFAMLKDLPPDSTFEVQTPTAIATVRGSEYRTTFDPGVGTRVYNFSESPVTVHGVDSQGQATGEPLVLKNSQKTEVVKQGEAPAAAQDLQPAELSEGNALAFSVEENRKDFAGNGAAAAYDGNPTAVLEAMVAAYQDENISGFMSHVSENYPHVGELREFARRDFMDYDGLRIHLFIQRVVRTPDGAVVRADWQLQCFPTTSSRSLELRGSDQEFVFTLEDGTLKLSAMRGPNPLFASRSSEIATLSGVPSSITSVLETIEDTGNRPAKQFAITLSAESEGVPSQSVPVNMEITSIVATDFLDTTEYNLMAMPGPTSYRFAVYVRLVDNPKNVDLRNVSLEVTDAGTGTVLRGSGDILSGVTNRIITDDSIVLIASSDSTVTFVLDPGQEFTVIDRDTARESGRYDVL